MTGPEHYQRAEALLKVVDEGSVDWPSTVATAQVHATLALAAAYAEVNPTSMWHEVAVSEATP